MPRVDYLGTGGSNMNQMDLREIGPNIFLSHSSEDKDFVEELAADLRDVNVEVWVAQGEIRAGDSLIEKIESGIARSDYLGVVLSKASIDSRWVQREVRSALYEEIAGRQIKVLPLLIEDVQVPLFLRDKLYLDFRDPTQYWSQFQRLVDRLGVSEKLVEPRSIRKLLMAGMTQIESLYEEGEIGETGFPTVDATGLSWSRGSLVAVAGWPQVLASVFLDNVVLHAACKKKTSVLSVSPGYGQNDLIRRILAIESRVAQSRLSTGSLTDVDWTRLSGAIGRLAEAPWSFITDAQVGVLDIERFLRRSRRNSAVPRLIAVHDLDRLVSGSASDRRSLLRALKQLSQEFDTCILVATALTSKPDPFLDEQGITDQIPRDVFEEVKATVAMDKGPTPERGNVEPFRIVISRDDYTHSRSITLDYNSDYRSLAERQEPNPPAGSPTQG
jgi:hypothetical protein